MAKDKAIMFRVTDADKQEIEDQAQKLGLSLSSYFLMLHKKNTNKGGNTMRNLNTHFILLFLNFFTINDFFCYNKDALICERGNHNEEDDFWSKIQDAKK